MCSECWRIWEFLPQHTQGLPKVGHWDRNAAAVARPGEGRLNSSPRAFLWAIAQGPYSCFGGAVLWDPIWNMLYMLWGPYQGPKAWTVDSQQELSEL